MVAILDGRKGNSSRHDNPVPMLDRRQFLLSLALMGVAGMRSGAQSVKHWNVGHRGGAKLAPENTLEAFSKAVALGCDAFELDIHLTTDQDLVVIHDDTLDRTSHRPGVVRQMTLSELQAADPSIPSLRQALRVARGHCRVLVEIKHPQGGRHEGIEPVLLEQLEQEKMLDQVVVICFEKESLRRLRSQVLTGYLYGSAVDAAQIQEELGVGFLCPHYGLATPQMIAQAHSLGMRVNAWTVNEEADMRNLIGAGCDAITSDRPDLLNRVLGR